MIALFMSIHVLTLCIKLEEKRIIETPIYQPCPSCLLTKEQHTVCFLGICRCIDSCIPLHVYTFDLNMNFSAFSPLRSSIV